MIDKIGYNFSEFGGNVEIVIVKNDYVDLNNSNFLKSLEINGQFKQLKGQKWSFLDQARQVEFVAREASKEFLTTAIYFFYGDASGWMGYKFFENGIEIEEYSFGHTYDDEMIEMGHDPNLGRKPGSIVATSQEGDRFIFWSQSRSKSFEEIRGGTKFIDEFLCSQAAYIGWQLVDEDAYN